MTSQMSFRFAVAGLALTLTAASPTPPQAILLDCQVIPIRCSPDDVCRFVAGTIPAFDEYHFALNKSAGIATQTNKTTHEKIITTTSSGASSNATTDSTNGTTTSSSTEPTKATSDESRWSSSTTTTPTPIPSTKPEAVTKKTSSRETSDTTTTVNAPGAATIAMLDTPHDFPVVGYTLGPLIAKPTVIDSALTWYFTRSVFPQTLQTRFVLWRDTLRLDVMTLRQRHLLRQDVRLLNRSTKPDGEDQYGPLYDVTILWSGPCSQATTQLP